MSVWTMVWIESNTRPFLGQLNRGLQEELLLRIQKRMGKKAGNVQLIPICATDWQARLVHIEEPSRRR